MDQLYSVEAKTRERELGAQEPLEKRQLHRVPVLRRIEALLLLALMWKVLTQLLLMAHICPDRRGC
jgi:hypothetical protein